MPREPSGNEKGNTSLVVTGEGPIARCCPVDASEEECRAYLASGFGQDPGECKLWQKRERQDRQTEYLQVKRERERWLDDETPR